MAKKAFFEHLKRGDNFRCLNKDTRLQGELAPTREMVITCIKIQRISTGVGLIANVVILDPKAEKGRLGFVPDDAEVETVR